MSPLVASSLTRLKRTLAWSNTRQAWEERLSVAFLIFTAAGIAWLGLHIQLAHAALAWGLWVIAAAVLLRRGWLHLVGPMLFFDLLRLTRRKRYFILRCLYAFALMFFLCSQFLSLMVGRTGGITSREMATFAEQFFLTFMAVQFVAVILLTPAYTAGAIAEEKERKTLEFILITDLRDREIVLSKFLSRLANILLLVITGLPILSFLQFLGGVDPNLMLVGFALTGLTVLSLGALSIFNSVLTQKPRDAIALTYMMALGYMALSGASWILIPWLNARALATLDPTQTFDVSVYDLVQGFNAGNIVALFIQLVIAFEQGKALADVMPGMLRNYAIFHGILALCCCGGAILRMRAVSLKQLYGQTNKATARARWRIRPGIGVNPMIWKELFVEPGLRLNIPGRFVVGCLILLSFVPLYFIFFETRSWVDVPEVMNAWVRFAGAAVACMLLLAVAARACSSISIERDRQTLDALLTSPLTTNNILFAKLLGNVFCVRKGWIWLGLIYGLGLLSGGLHPLAVPLLLGAWFVYATVVSGIGLWFSLVCKTTLRATIWTLFTSAMAGVGHWLIWMCCGPLLMFMGTPERDFEWLLRFQAGITPPATFGWAFSFPLEGYRWDYDDREMLKAIGFGIVGLIFWTIVAAILWGVTSARFMMVTGRSPFRSGQSPGPTRRPQPPAESDDLADVPEVLAVDEEAIRSAKPDVQEPPSSSAQGAILLEEEWQEDEPGKPPEQSR
jgi:ABC-type transport system involved in multi-copper enzyme maturation permease subunit